MLALCAAPSAARADRYKDCGPDAEKNINKGVVFLNKHMSAIVDQFTFLSARQRQEIVRKWPEMKIKCNDDSRLCRKHNGIDVKGHAHGGPGNTVSLCHGNMIDSGSTVCGVVGILMHEMGHAHGLREVPGHNDPTPYVRAHDPMYRMGAIASEYCVKQAERGPFVNSPFEGAKRAPLLAGCRHNSDCSSGRCWVKLDGKPFEVAPQEADRGVCVCNDDGDCGKGPKCYKPLGKQPYCSSTHKKLQESCQKDSQCASNKCERGECVCRHDNDCPGFPDARCKTPITGKNYCERK
jgi:hypothetical protein